MASNGIKTVMGMLYPERSAEAFSGIHPTERLLITEMLRQMYPRLIQREQMPYPMFLGPIIPDFVMRHTQPGLRRIVEIGCGDGLLSNTLSLLFPEIEIIGIDPDRDKIAQAKKTIGARNNLKFICANPVVLACIPCDRIIYSHCLSSLKNVMAFKKLIIKTSDWIVEEGDFIVKESPVQILKTSALFKTLFSSLRRNRSISSCLSQLLADTGYPQVVTHQTPALQGLLSDRFYHIPKSANLDVMKLPMDTFCIPAPNQISAKMVPSSGLMRQGLSIETSPTLHSTAGQQWGDQSNDTVVEFLFANRQSNFAHELV